MFSTAEAAEIGTEFRAVRILGGNDLDEVGEAFLQRYGVRGYPTLLAVTAGGDLLDGDLMGGRLRTAPEILAALRAAKAANDAFLSERVRLESLGDAKSLRRLAELHRARRNLAAARETLETILETDGDAPVEVRKELLSVLARTEDRDAERAMLDDVVERYPDDEDHTEWLVRRATMHIPRPTSMAEMESVIGEFAAAIEQLRGEAAKAGRTSQEAELRVSLAKIAADRSDEETYQAHVDWVLEHAVEDPAAREIQMLRARRAMDVQDYAAAKEYAAWVVDHGAKGLQAAAAHQLLGDIAYGEDDWEAMERHFRAVLAAAPESRFAQIAEQALDAIERRKAEEARAPKEGSEGPQTPPGDADSE